MNYGIFYLGDDCMKPSSAYHITQNEVKDIANKYLVYTHSDVINDFTLVDYQNKILDLNYFELIILQSDSMLWRKLCENANAEFRRRLICKFYNLTPTKLSQIMNKTRMTLSNVFTKGSNMKEPDRYELAILLNHPYQLIFFDRPNRESYFILEDKYVSADTHFIPRISVQQISSHYVNTDYIKAVLIKDISSLLPSVTGDCLGRWVKTYPEFHYFELILPFEPIIDNVFKKKTKQLIPNAKYLLTTFLPMRETNYRSIWMIIPQNTSSVIYQNMLYELSECREKSEWHYL